MGKKLITVCLGLVALAAFALPTGASAAEIQHPTGMTLATGTALRGTLAVSPSIMWNTAKTIKLLECTNATMTGTLTVNDPEPRADITSAEFAGTGAVKDGRPECTGDLLSSSVDVNLGNGVPWCLTLTSSTTFSMRGNSCNLAARSITFVLTSTTAGTCAYNRTTAISGVVQNDVIGQDAIAAVSAIANNASTEWTLESGGFLCPSAGLLEMSFTLEKDQETATPVFVR